MRRILLTLGATAALLPPVATAAAAEPPPLGVKVTECETGLDVADRAAEFTGAMPAVAGSSALSMRFDLEQRRTSGWKPVVVPGFGRWERSAADAAGFVYAKRIERLVAGSAYRVKVRFRWADTSGKVLKEATRRSAACRQPDLRPNLEVTSLSTGEPAGTGRSRYVVQVRNGGLGAVLEPFRIGLSVDGVPLAPQSLAGLPVAALGSVVFDGPNCTPGSAVTATVDPDDGVAEALEDDNALRVTCPA